MFIALLFVVIFLSVAYVVLVQFHMGVIKEECRRQDMGMSYYVDERVIAEASVDDALTDDEVYEVLFAPFYYAVAVLMVIWWSVKDRFRR